MPVGVPESEVFAAADRVLARGERPTVERVRAELGRGSPARVGQLLESWWDTLAKRLAGHAALPALPEEVAAAFTQVWAHAAGAGQRHGEGLVAQERTALQAAQIELAQTSAQQGQSLAAAIADSEAAQAIAAQSTQRLIDLQQRLDEQATALAEVRTQRETALKRVAELEHALTEARTLAIEVQRQAASERLDWAAQIRALEDRAHREIDRARQELKTAQGEAKAAGRSAQQREQTLQQALQVAECTVAEQAGRLSALAAPHSTARKRKSSPLAAEPPKPAARHRSARGPRTP